MMGVRGVRQLSFQLGKRVWRGPGQHPDKINEGAHNEGSVNDKAEASAARCTYAARAASDDNKAATSAIKAGAYEEGSNGDKAAASAARHAYAARVAANDNKAVASPARRARTVIAALRTTEVDNGAHNEGSLDNKAKASAKRHTYAAHAAADDNEASAFAARHTPAAIVARCTAGGGDIDNRTFDEGSDNDEAAESATRRGHASAASNEDEALAPAARRVRAASAA